MYKVIDKNACIRADPQTKYTFDSQTGQLKSYAGKFEGNCLLADGWFWPKLRSCNDSAQQKMELVGNKIKTSENNKCLTLFDNSNRFKFDDCVDGGNVEFTTVVQGMSTDSPTDAPIDSPTDSLPADAVVSFKTADGRCLWYDTHGGMYKVIDKNACIRADPQTKYTFDSQTGQLKSYAGKFEGNCLLADGWFWPKLRSCNDSAQQKMELVGNKIKTSENNKCLTLFDNSNRFKFDDCVDGGNVEFTTVVLG